MKVGTFITDVYKYTEKIERKKANKKEKMQTPALPDRH
jgi:hypothetical protein